MKKAIELVDKLDHLVNGVANGCVADEMDEIIDKLRSLLTEEGVKVTKIDSMKDEIYTYFGDCPDCGKSVMFCSKFCNNCGLKLIWPEDKASEGGEGE